MERFARAIVGGGLALVAGLWIVALVAARSLPWAVGVALVLVGVVGLAGGIRDAVDY